MKALLVLALLTSGCMIDRTGQSATSRLAREASITANRAQDAEKLAKKLADRVTSIEEVIVYRGEQEELELENLEGIQMEIRRLRNDVETLQRAEEQSRSATEAFRGDADVRISETLQRLERLEAALGISGLPTSPAAATRSLEQQEPAEEGSADERDLSEDSAVDEPNELAEEGVQEEPSEPVDSSEFSIDKSLLLAEQALTDGQPRVARAVIERAMRELEGASSHPELLYRYAETYFSEGLYEQAGLRYQSVVDQDSSSSWAAWAMVRQGECFKHLGNTDGARFFWEDVIRQYPDSEAAKLAKTLLEG